MADWMGGLLAVGVGLTGAIAVLKLLYSIHQRRPTKLT